MTKKIIDDLFNRMTDELEDYRKGKERKPIEGDKKK
jgi:hypothetical protein